MGIRGGIKGALKGSVREEKEKTQYLRMLSSEILHLSTYCCFTVEIVLTKIL